MPTLTLPLEKLAYIIEKAREYDAEVPGEVDESGTNAADDGDEFSILEDTPDNPTAEELRSVVDDLNIDEREELLALMWIGRGDFEAEDWRTARRQARETANATETSYLLGTPLLGDYLAEGAAALGLSLED